jgi:hypothetical protein
MIATLRQRLRMKMTYARLGFTQKVARMISSVTRAREPHVKVMIWLTKMMRAFMKTECSYYEFIVILVSSCFRLTHLCRLLLVAIGNVRELGRLAPTTYIIPLLGASIWSSWKELASPRLTLPKSFIVSIMLCSPPLDGRIPTTIYPITAYSKHKWPNVHSMLCVVGNLHFDFFLGIYNILGNTKIPKSTKGDLNFNLNLMNRSHACHILVH